MGTMGDNRPTVGYIVVTETGVPMNYAVAGHSCYSATGYREGGGTVAVFASVGDALEAITQSREKSRQHGWDWECEHWQVWRLVRSKVAQSAATAGEAHSE